MDIARIAGGIRPLDSDAQNRARARQDNLTKPKGSLGRLEDLSIQLAGIYRTDSPHVRKKVIFTIAADHGICAEGVSAYPSEVTAQMILNFASGGAAINVLGRHVGAEVITVDIGVAGDHVWPASVVSSKVRKGTRNMAKEQAMTAEEAEAAISKGIDLAANAVSRGANLLGIGDMGIGNTTSATALTAVFTGNPVSKLTGRGTGLDDAGLQRKIKVIEEVIRLHRPDPAKPLDVLQRVGGLEIAGMAGVILGAASAGVPVVLDGFISSSSALVAAGIAPQAKSYMIASHKSVEIGHAAILEYLGLEPLFDLRMRLGEGTGAALAMNFIEASCKILDEMATFDSAGVSKKKDGE
jgi:nicotinate-nucleotide--dimethylbenzimidazole phosphoribosyltransferase